MKITRSALGLFLFVAFLSSASNGQTGTSPRTFVSGTAPFGNSCSRLAPCRTFVEALTQTAPGDEVVVLDSGAYGPAPVTITHAVSIIAPPGVYAGISVPSGDGIEINAGASDTVILRGLTVTNQGNAGNGVVFNTGLKLHVEACVLNGFPSNLSAGLNLRAGGAQVEVIDSIVRGNYIGILVQPSSGTEEATIDHVRLEANDGTGLVAREGSQVTVTNSVAASNNIGLTAHSASSGSVQMNVESTVVSANTSEGVGIEAETEGTGAVQVNVARCVISGNLVDGIFAVSFSTGVATVRLSSSTVTGNGTGLRNQNALLLSRQDNTVEGNTTDTSGTIGTYTAK